MLNFFRKAQIPLVAIIAVMFLFSLQQSFSRTVSKMGYYESNGLSSTVIFTSNFVTISGTVIDIDNHYNDFFIANTEQHNLHDDCCNDDCCNDDGCDSSCPNTSSFIALIPAVEFDTSFELHTPKFFFDLRNTLILPSVLFRPPRTILS